MYKTFRARQFRCFDDLQIENCTRVNLIAGKNSVGKTTLLEALFVHAGTFNPDLVSVIGNLRGLQKILVDPSEHEDSPWDSVFHNFDNKRQIELEGEAFEHYTNVRLSNLRSSAELEGLSLSVRRTYQQASTSDDANAKVLKLEVRRDRLKLKRHDADKLNPKRYFLVYDSEGKKILPQPPRPPFPAKIHIGSIRGPTEAEATRISRVLLKGHEKALLDALSVMEPRLKDIELIHENGETTLQGDIGFAKRRFVPLALMGEGLGRVASVVALIASTEGGVVFMDDIDSGLHHSVLPAVWDVLRRVVEIFNCQVFITTHRGESIDAAYLAFSGNAQSELSVHRIDRSSSRTVVTTYDHETLGAALSGKLEVR